MAMPAIQRRWTAADVRDLMREDRPWPRYEVIDGELFVTNAPRIAHQIAVTELWSLLKDYLHREPLGLATISPSDIELKADNITQPDVFVVPRYGTPLAGERIEWPDVKSLLLAAEVISPSSRRTDRVDKRVFYLANGVEEYWIVDLDAQAFERWFPGLDKPVVLRDEIVWTPRGGNALVIDLPAYFARIDAMLRMFEP